MHVANVVDIASTFYEFKNNSQLHQRLDDDVRSNGELMTEKMYFGIVPFWSLGMHTICKFLHDDASCHIGHSICGDSS